MITYLSRLRNRFTIIFFITNYHFKIKRQKNLIFLIKVYLLYQFEMEKISSFGLDYNFFENPVRTSLSLSLANVTYHSQDHSKVVILFNLGKS